MNKHKNPPAFAAASTGLLQSGMTLRDYFAGQALIALPHMGCGCDLNVRDAASASYQIADAMLEARGS